MVWASGSFVLYLVACFAGGVSWPVSRGEGRDIMKHGWRRNAVLLDEVEAGSERQEDAGGRGHNLNNTRKGEWDGEGEAEDEKEQEAGGRGQN